MTENAAPAEKVDIFAQAVLEDLVREMASVRESYEDAEEEMGDIKNAFRNSPRYQQLDTLTNSLAGRLMHLEDKIRERAYQYFEETGDKKPIDGVELKIFENVHFKYDPDQALRWAVEHAPSLLTLNTKQFEKLAKINHDGPRPLPKDLVEVIVEKEPRVQIARDLTAYTKE